MRSDNALSVFFEIDDTFQRLFTSMVYRLFMGSQSQRKFMEVDLFRMLLDFTNSKEQITTDVPNQHRNVVMEYGMCLQWFII